MEKIYQTVMTVCAVLMTAAAIGAYAKVSRVCSAAETALQTITEQQRRMTDIVERIDAQVLEIQGDVRDGIAQVRGTVQDKVDGVKGKVQEVKDKAEETKSGVLGIIEKLKK